MHGRRAFTQGNGLFKDPKAEACLVYSNDHRETSVARAKTKGRVIGNEVSMGTGLNRVLWVIVRTGFYYEWRGAIRR